MKTLENLFLSQLADMYDAEKRLVKALPKMAGAATCEDLKGAIEHHLEQTEGHVLKLEKVFESLGRKARGTTCQATAGLVKEADEMAEEFEGSSAINAALIAAAQKVEHYEIATYGCLHEWAGLLDFKEAAGFIESILDEEKTANKTLTQLARSNNRDALGAVDEHAAAR